VSTYEQAGFTYEQAGVTYESTAILFTVVAGDQPSASGALSVQTAHQRVLTGNQPVGNPSLYNDPLVLYEQTGIHYEDAGDPAALSWSGVFHRLLAGNEPFPTGAVSWAWHPYTWAEYTWAIGSVPESTVYAMSVTGTDQVQYEHTGSHDDARTEAEYSHRPIAPHTRDTP
jgi:hypothetical protein